MRTIIRTQQLRKPINFSERRMPWSGFGRKLEPAGSMKELLSSSSLDWKVIQKPVMTAEETPKLIPNAYVNMREDNREALGIVTKRYQVIQNAEAFRFADSLIKEGIQFERAGIFQGGKKVWILGKLPESFTVTGDQVTPYFLLLNSHDGSGGVRAAITPVRVLCSNMLNLAFRQAERSWCIYHTGSIDRRTDMAARTISGVHSYMKELNAEAERLHKVILPDARVHTLLDKLLPLKEDLTARQEQNIKLQREELMQRYLEAPDLRDIGKNGYRFLNAVSDFATHAEPIRKTENYQENLFARSVDGLSILDKAYTLLQAA